MLIVRGIVGGEDCGDAGVVRSFVLLMLVVSGVCVWKTSQAGPADGSVQLSNGGKKYYSAL